MNKPFWKSKTVWGALIAAVPVVGPALSAALLSVPDAASAPVPGELQALIAGIGAAVAIYGRWKASGDLTLK